MLLQGVLLALATGVAAPSSLHVTATNSGAVILQFSWKMDCPQDVCLMPQSFQAMRGGQVVASVDAGDVPATSQQLVPYTIAVPAGSWNPGDCFQVRAVAPAASSNRAELAYSDLSNKVCLPS
ncbi:MAG: hypothetical protein JO190_10015 [Candidatus Eremiobacteraeota bacterium]|nr:hypothetical protein [Candidatus Eremiobacteraeota bacterium]MBV8499974.1 hypothetical protein [Candidatus Eremiobacteraeota bacterium]